MPTWNPQANDLFLKAREMGSTRQRQEYLDGACAGEADLRAEVEALLEASAQAGSFLESPKLELVATVDEPPVRERPGTVIGPYKLLEPIGEGGFGVVFMAEQTQPVRRKVALKVLKPGMDSKQVIARFEAERQALALMDHPNIARVFDAGETASGRPYFVMELVRGVPITDFCDNNHFPVHRRLELFVSVCHAVQHAHQKGIIHRDLKPSNVLVTLHDGRPVVKVIDFGVAKALGQQLTDKTLFTGFVQMVGTPLYMSPEQAEMSGLDVDTRSDVYSLGVLLYELLTGTTPFDKDRLRTAGYDEMRRIIREEEPARPSARISTLGAVGATVSANRGSEPRRLSQLFRGELDWIVMKALEKDRTRRYESASGFAADAQRYLADEPVLACPPSIGYRLRKFARRNKHALATMTLLGGMLVVAVAALAVSYARTNEALSRQTQARQELDEALEREKLTSYSQRLALAGRELAAGNVGRAEELLDNCPSPLRGWEWYFLKRQRYGNSSPLQHLDTVRCVTFSPDGRQIATAGLDGKVRVWDARATRPSPLHTLLPAMPVIRTMAYSRDGLHLAAGDRLGRVSVWKAATGEPVAFLPGHEKIVWQIAFSPDGQSLASASQDGTVRLWDITARPYTATDRLIRVLSDHPAEVKGVSFHPGGGQLLAACRDGTVKTWDVANGREVASFRRPIQYVDFASFSEDGRRVAWACLDGVVKAWDVVTGNEEFAVPSDTGLGRTVAFSPDGRRIAVAGFDGTVRLLDSSTGREKLTIYAHPSLVSAVAFSADGHRLASASYDHTVRIWDATPLTTDPLAPDCVTLTGHKQQVYGVAFSPDGRWLASGGLDRTVKVWEVAGQGDPGLPAGAITLRYTLRGHGDNVIGLAFSPDSKILASGSWDETVKLWDLSAPTGATLTDRVTIRRPDRVTGIAYSPKGQLLAIGQPGGIALYDPSTGKEAAPYKRTATPVPALTFSPDGRRLISAAATDACVAIWDVAGEKSLFEIRHFSNPNATVSISPDGRRIASAGRDHAAGDHAVKVWDVDFDQRAHSIARTLKGHVGYVWKVAFSPDGRYLASGSWDSTIKVWDLKAPASARPVTLRGHAGFIRSLAFSPDGRRLASASGYAGHGEVKVWSAALWQQQSSGER